MDVYLTRDRKTTLIRCQAQVMKVKAGVPFYPLTYPLGRQGMTMMRQPHRAAVQVAILGPGGIKGQGTQIMVIKRMIVSSLLVDSVLHRMPCIL